MANADHHHDEPVIIQLVQNSVVPYTQPVAMLAATEFDRTHRARLIGQLINDGASRFRRSGASRLN
jgi:hypothetical protein